MIVYISGKISHNPDYMKDFAKAEETLKRQGYEVINPAKLCTIMPESSSWDDYMDICKALLKKADRIAFLLSAKDSRGAKIESEWAEKLKIPEVELLCK